ncbi:hypothetical protein RS030_4614 [Cryptosporidium xiaoi]|uniref:Trafficking protein particle complex subunit 11 domain-containing protein n=1 Tax=Cryptosporidium xiaoi TaxID=659607 RepID=A0AAV9XVS2_9CRYT
MEGFHPDWQGYLKPLIALVAPESIQEDLYNSISSFRPKTSLFHDKYLELKCLTHKELLNPSISNFVTPSRNLIKSSLTISSSPSAYLGGRTGHGLGGIDILSVNWMYKVRYDTPALYILCFDWQEYPLMDEGSNVISMEDQERINSLENDAINVIRSISAMLKKRQSPPSVLIFVILPTGTRDPQSCVTCFRKNHFPELQAIFVTCGLKHQKQLNIRIERLAEMAYETSQAYYSENERRWRKSAIKAQTAGITASSENFINGFSVKSASSGLRSSFTGTVQSGLSPRFKRNSYISLSNSSNLSLIKNSNIVNYSSSIQRSAKNNSFTSTSSGNGFHNITQLQSKVLLIRYCIKSAVMNEFCGNFVLATKQYIAAWDNIMSETNIPSYQFVVFCNIISIRLYHIYVINGEIREAMNHLKIHTKILREFGLNHTKFSFLSSLWLSLILQKLASILFFYIINKQSNYLSASKSNFDSEIIRDRLLFPDGIESSVIPLSVNSKNSCGTSFNSGSNFKSFGNNGHGNNYKSLDSNKDANNNRNDSEDCVDNSISVENAPASFNKSEKDKLYNEADDLGNTLSFIAKSIQNIVIKTKTPVSNGFASNSAVTATTVSTVGSNKSDYTGAAPTTRKQNQGRNESETCSSRNQDNNIVDILLNISKLYKVSAEYSHKSKKQLFEISENYSEDFFSVDIDIGGEILSPVSLGCFEELSSPESFLEYEQKPNIPKGFFNNLITFSSLYIGYDNIDIKQIEDKNLLCEILASCEIARRYIRKLLYTNSLFNRCISLFYMSAVVYRHFYPNKSKTLLINSINNENEVCNDIETVNITKNDISDNFGSKNYMNRFFYMISFSFAEYLFDENYINCSLSIYESIFKAIIPKHIFSEIEELKKINVQELRNMSKKRGSSVWDTLSQQIMNTCFHITNNFIKSRTWLFIRKICLRIITCLSIQNLSLEDNRNELTKMCGLVSWSCESGDDDFLVKLNKKILNFGVNNGGGTNYNLNNKQDDQYIYSVVTSFLTVINSKKSWIESNDKSDKNSIHFYILFFCYIIIACDIENNSDNNIACKRDIFEFHDWIIKLYIKIINLKDNERVVERNDYCISNCSRNVILTQFLYNTYSTIEYDVDSPSNIKIEIHHLPNFVYKLVDDRMGIELISNIGILKVEIKNFELYEFKEENNFNIRIRLDCVIDKIDFTQISNDVIDLTRYYYKEYIPEIMIIGLFSYFNVGPCYNDYIKFAINSIKYFDFKKTIGKSSKYIYNYSYVQFCLRNPPLSYFSNLGSWLRNSKTLIYSTPKLNVVPGGFLDINTNTVVNPIPLFKVPFDQVYFASRIRLPYYSLPIFCKLNTKNMLLTDKMNERMLGIQRQIETLKKVCKLWLLSPFNTLNVALSETKDRIDSIEKVTYNSVVNELKPLELLLRLPGDISENFKIEINFNVNKLIPRDYSSHYHQDNDENSISKLGYIKIPNEKIDGNKWEVIFSESKILLDNTNNCRNNVINNNQNILLYSSSSSSLNNTRFMIDYKLLTEFGDSSNPEDKFAFIMNKANEKKMVRFSNVETSIANSASFSFAPQNNRDQNNNYPPTPFFKIMRDENTIPESEDICDRNGPDEVNSNEILLLLPLFLSINKNGEYEVTINVRIIDLNKDDSSDQNPCVVNNIIIHELNISRKWFIGECVTINSKIPEMNSLNGNVNYLNLNFNQLESKIVPINDNMNQLFCIMFEILNKQYKDVIFIDKFILPKKFSMLDDNFPIILGGYESNSILINITKDDLHNYYLSEKGKSVNDEILENIEYSPEVVISLLYNLSCEVQFFRDNLQFLNFVLYPFQLIIPNNESNLACGDIENMKLSFKSLPIHYNLSSNLLNTLILPYTKFFPITLETKTDRIIYAKTPFTYEAIITNHTNLPQSIKYSLIYPPDSLISNKNNPSDNQPLPTWLPLLTQGITSNYTILSPNSKKTLKWICIPTQSGTIPLPCIHIQSDRSNKQFIDNSNNPKASRHIGGSSYLKNNYQTPSILYTSEKRIVVIPRS